MELQYQLSYPQLDRIKKYSRITGKSHTRFVQSCILMTITEFCSCQRTHPEANQIELEPLAKGLSEEIFTVKIPKKYQKLYEDFYEYYIYNDSDLLNGTIELVLQYFEGNWNGELTEDDTDDVDVSGMDDKEKFQLLKDTNQGENFNVYF